MTTAHVVCRECGTRWEAERTPTRCMNEECDAGWLDMPQFVDKRDADRAAAIFAQEKVAR